MRADLCALELGRMLLGRQHGAVCWKRFTSQGLLVKQRKNRIIYHGTWAAHFHSSCGVVVEWLMWGCGGVGKGNVVERGSAWWVHAPEHGTCAVITACSYVVVGVICVIVNLYSRF